MDGLTHIEILKLKNEEWTRVNDPISVEEPLELKIHYYSKGIQLAYPLSITMRTPGNEKEWALGFLFSEGVIEKKGEVESIELVKSEHHPYVQGVEVYLSAQSKFDPSKVQRHFYTTSSCGVCGKSSVDNLQQIIPFVFKNEVPKVSDLVLKKLPDLLKDTQSLFNQTGSIHAAFLLDSDGKLRSVREDVGRHNALDKLIGANMEVPGLPLSEYILLLSGRASFELIQKALMSGICFVVAIGAPSSLAIELARAYNLTLCGFLKENGFNVYSGEQRISRN